MNAQQQPYKLALVEAENRLAGEVVDTWIKTAERTPTIPVLPPGLDATAWAELVTQLKVILGDDGVLTSHEHRIHYSDPYAKNQDGKEQERRGSAATLFPVTVEDIQKVLKICNKHSIPIWTVSRGMNLGYGGSAAIVKGSIILDLRRMTKVLEVNDRYSYYTVEPGVTFFDIYRAIQEQEKNLWCSCPALGWGSVVGNALDRGWGYTPAGDHSNQICGIEVVLADGTLVRTGMGALKDSICGPLFRGGYGPTYESIFSQSNYGIVTKLSIWASPSPEGFMICNLNVENEADLSPMLDIFRKLLMNDTIQNHPVIGNIIRELGKRGKRSQFYNGKGAIPDVRLEELKKELDVGYWSARFGLYGPKEILEFNYKRCQQAFEKLPGTKLVGRAFYPPKGKNVLSPEDLPVECRTVETGTPSLVALKSLQYRGDDGGHLSFSPILPPEGKAALEFYHAVKACCAEHGFDYFGGLHLYPRHLAMINMIYFDRQDETDRCNANKLFVDLVPLARKYGYSEYRAHVDYMDLVAEQFDFNERSLMRLNERIKDAVDPKGILSPGKQGIWPKRFRDCKDKTASKGVNGATCNLAL